MIALYKSYYQPVPIRRDEALREEFAKCASAWNMSYAEVQALYCDNPMDDEAAAIDANIRDRRLS